MKADPTNQQKENHLGQDENEPAEKGILKPSGLHHRTTWSGSVQAAKIVSREASNTWEIRTPRAGVPPGLVPL